jgi:[histone H3]-dimethyl/trimethyl-L-lysine36 demethylase
MTIARLLKPIPTYSQPSLSTTPLASLLHRNEPLILSQCFLNMPAINKWPQPTHLQNYANHPIEIEVSSRGTSGYGERHETTLGDYLDLLSVPLPYRIYMSQVPLFKQIPELQKDVTTPLITEILGQGEEYSTSTWIGKQSLTPLHHDPRALTNLFVQICGRKEFRLFSPDMSKEVLHVGEGTLRNTASVDVWNSDIGEGFEGVVNSGDGIIIPRGWWHSVRSVEDELCMSVNWWVKLRDKRA